MISAKIVIPLLSLKLLNMTNEPSPLSTCLDIISSKFLTNKGNTWLSSSNKHSVLFETKSLKNHTVSIKFGELELYSDFWQRTENYMIESSNVSELEDALEHLKYIHSWNSQARFFVIVTNIFNQTQSVKILGAIAETLFNEGIYNFILITEEKNQSDIVNVYTWYPYRCKNGFDFSKLRLLETCYKGKLRNNSDLFPRKIPRIFKFCELKVGAVIWPPYVMKPEKRVANTDQYIIKEGLEVRIIQAIITKLRMNVSYTVSEKALNWGLLYENGTGTGLMALLRKQKVDVAIASLTPSERRLKFFQTSKSYFVESLAWCVPHAPTQPGWKKMLDAINLRTWLFFCLSFIAFSVVIWLMSKRAEEETYYKKYINCLQASFSIALSVAVRNQPKTLAMRWIACFWLLFSLNFGILYETKLVSVLSRTIYDDQINSPEEILEEELKILFPGNVQNYIDKKSSFNEEIIKRSSECNELRECLSRVAYKKDSALCLSSSYMDYIKKSYVTNKNFPLIHCFPSKVATYPVILLMKKGFPLSHRFNLIISHLIESGFIDMWAKDIYHSKWKSEEMAKLNNTIDDKYLNLTKIKTAFVCLLGGLTIATVVFFGEIVYFVYTYLKGKVIFIV